ASPRGTARAAGSVCSSPAGSAPVTRRRGAPRTPCAGRGSTRARSTPRGRGTPTEAPPPRSCPWPSTGRGRTTPAGAAPARGDPRGALANLPASCPDLRHVPVACVARGLRDLRPQPRFEPHLRRAGGAPRQSVRRRRRALERGAAPGLLGAPAPAHHRLLSPPAEPDLACALVARARADRAVGAPPRQPGGA